MFWLHYCLVCIAQESVLQQHHTFLLQCFVVVWILFGSKFHCCVHLGKKRQLQGLLLSFSSPRSYLIPKLQIIVPHRMFQTYWLVCSDGEKRYSSYKSEEVQGHKTYNLRHQNLLFLLCSVPSEHVVVKVLDPRKHEYTLH